MTLPTLLMPLRALRARPRLLLAALVGVLVGLCWPQGWDARPVTRWIVAWNCGAVLYLLLVGGMVAGARMQQIHRRALTQDDGARAVLALVTLASLTSLGAIVAELSLSKDLHGADKLLHVALALVTIATSWAFTQVMFALHYAHDYYLSKARGQDGGLSFPETTEPDYLDFLYFSVVIGTSGQTADVSLASREMRRIGMLHCVLAFVFNTSLVGLMINVASSLL